MTKWSLLAVIYIAIQLELGFIAWYLLRVYNIWTFFYFFICFGCGQERGVDPADLISFLLELSFHVTGEV